MAVGPKCRLLCRCWGCRGPLWGGLGALPSLLVTKLTSSVPPPPGWSPLGRTCPWPLVFRRGCTSRWTWTPTTDSATRPSWPLGAGWGAGGAGQGPLDPSGPGQNVATALPVFSLSVSVVQKRQGKGRARTCPKKVITLSPPPTPPACRACGGQQVTLCACPIVCLCRPACLWVAGAEPTPGPLSSGVTVTEQKDQW